MKTKTILVADDDAAIRKMLRKMLEQSGHKVQEATNGNECIDIISNGLSPELVILDILMPMRDGVETLLELKQKCPLAKVIAISGGATGSLRSGTNYLAIAKGLGAEATLEKPFDLEDLEKVIQSIFPEEPKVEQTGATTKSASLRFLSVDDNMVNQKMMELFLKRFFGSTPDKAFDGLEALELIKRNPYDLIFMDCMMPEMDGYETTRNIRAGKCGDKSAKTPIVAITARTTNGHKEKCLGIGMNDYLNKPARPHEIKTIVNKWIPKDTPFSQAAHGTHSAPQELFDRSTYLDLSKLKELYDGDIDITQEILGLFITETNETLEELRNSINADVDFKKLGLICHRIRSTASTLGIAKLVDISTRLESNCSEAGLGIVHELTSTMQRVSKEAAEISKSLQGTRV